MNNNNQHIIDNYFDETITSSIIISKEVIRQLAGVQIQSVVDFGCGIGAWLKAFKDIGVLNVKGYDNNDVDYEALYRNISPHEFESIDFEHFDINQYTSNFDLVLCLEVAEHVSESQANKLVHLLTNSGHIVLFSAAIPQQGGNNHINEQWPDYWVEKFANYGFTSYDTIRLRIWDNDEILDWYKQNIHFYINSKDESLESLRKRLLKMTPEKNNTVKRLVHPSIYLSKC